MDDVSRGKKQQPEVRMKVWQPQDFSGVEVGVKRSAPVISFPKQVMQTYDIVLNGIGQGEVRYGGERHTFDNTQGLVFAQQPGEVFAGEFVGEGGASGACLSLSFEKMQSLRGVLGVPEMPYFPDILPPEAVMEPLARLTADTLRAFYPTRIKSISTSAPGCSWACPSCS